MEELLDLPDPIWVVVGLILEWSLVMLYGSPKSYKTFIALDLALCIATGRPFHGHNVVRGRVAYIAAEGHQAETRDRVLAWCKANSVALSELRDWFVLGFEGVMLDQPESVKAFIKENPAPRDIIFYDTLNRNMSGHESDTKDMTAVVKGGDRIRRELKTTVVIVHHTGVDASRERGSTVLRGAVDTRLKVTQKGGVATLLVEDQRAGPDGEVLHLRPVTSAVGDFEDSRTSLVMQRVVSEGYQDQGAPKVSSGDRMLVRIYKREPEQYADLAEKGVVGMSPANIYKVRDRLRTEGYLTADEQPTLTQAGRIEAERLMEDGVDEAD
jgi:hypothetical protein